MFFRKQSFAVLLSASVAIVPTWAGDLDPPSAPSDPGSAMYQMEDIYNRLDTGAPGSKRAGAFTDPASGPGSTGRTLDEVMGKAPQVDNVAGAVPGEVLAGKNFWGLRSDGTWGATSGTLATQTIDNSQTSQAAGNYAGFDLAVEDTDLAAPNITTGTTIYGVSGTALISTGDAVAADVLTSKTFSNTGAVGVAGTMTDVGAQNITPGIAAQGITEGYHNGAGSVAGDADLTASNIAAGSTIFGVTGGLHGGCNCSTGSLNGTRWCNNGDGTVTDLLGDTSNNNFGRCLVWLQNANCTTNLAGIDKTTNSGYLFWDDAQVWSSALTDGVCGLSDGSSGFMWHLPTAAELDGITSGVEPVRTTSLRAFSGVGGGYWSSNPASNSGDTWIVAFDGRADNIISRPADQFTLFLSWSVRGGQ